MPNATLLSYSVWYAAIVMRISSRTRSKSSPRSEQLMVTCRISSSAQYTVSIPRPDRLTVVMVAMAPCHSYVEARYMTGDSTCNMIT